MESSSNPALNKKYIDRLSKTLESSESMTMSGTIIKIFWLLCVLSATGVWAWGFTENSPSSAFALTIGASITGFVLAMVIIFKKPSALLVTLYAAVQGILVGSISFLFSDTYQGIIAHAILFTICITLGMLFLFATRLVTVTKKLYSIILISTVGVLFFYVASFIISLFSSSFADFVYTGTSGVIFALIIVIIAALNLLLDFDFIDKGIQKELPKQFEWYGAFGIMVTLIWLYFSILRMLAASRR